MLDKITPDHSPSDDHEVMARPLSQGRVKPADEGVSLAEYYDLVGNLMLPHVKDRPLQIGRVSAHGVPLARSERLPEAVSVVTLPAAEGDGESRYILCQNARALGSLGSALRGTLFGWNSRFDKPHLPDTMVIDLNPPDVTYVEELAETAFLIKELLEEANMYPYVMTTGSRGLHVVCPLRRNRPFERVSAYLQEVAQAAQARCPELLTLDTDATRQGERIILDLGGNAYGKACVIPYAVRDMEHAPVATPLGWDELEASDLHPQRFTVATMADRLRAKGNVWENFFRHKRKLMR